MKTEQHITKKLWVNKEIQLEIYKYFETDDNENTTIHSKNKPRGKFMVIQAFLKKQVSNKQPNLPPKRVRKRTKKTPKVSRRKEIIKVRAQVLLIFFYSFLICILFISSLIFLIKDKKV